VIGASLSRWTLSYFAVALLALLTAQGLMAAGYGYPVAPIEAPQTLVLVHLVAIGWLSLLMCGALFQFVPVLVARPLFSNSLPLPTLICLVGGLAALIAGFLQLDGWIEPWLSVFPLAGVLLGLGFALMLWNLGRTLWAARPLSLPARFVVVGLFSLAATAALGIIFALVLGGVATQPVLSGLTAAAVPVHAVAGLGGWLTFSAMGVSYRLLSMFMLAPDLDRAITRSSFYVGTAALVVAVAGGTAAACHDGNVALVLTLAGVLGLAALTLYGADILHIYRARKRRRIELNSRMAMLALISLALAVAMMVAALALGALRQHLGAIVFLLAFGWLSGLGLAKLYKIVPFLTWLECYGPVLGKKPTPRVQDLVTEPRAVKWFALYFLAVWTGAVALIAGRAPLFRIAAAAMLIATCGIVLQLIRARRLADVAAAARLPEGARQPWLLVAHSKHT